MMNKPGQGRVSNIAFDFEARWAAAISGGPFYLAESTRAGGDIMSTPIWFIVPATIVCTTVLTVFGLVLVGAW